MGNEARRAATPDAGTTADAEAAGARTAGAEPAGAEPAAAGPPPVQDPRLLGAARRVLEDAGWQGLTIEAVAEAAGLSRVTAWRLGASRETLIAALLAKLDQDYREAMWTALVSEGTARARLDRALDALFGVIDMHLPLLLASDQVFHRVSRVRISFNEPFRRLFEDSRLDGSVTIPGGDPGEAADLVFNTVCWSYVHLRGRHHWPADRARRGMLSLITPGLDPNPAGS